MSSKGTIVYCNCSFEGGDGGFDSNECSDDGGESRGGRPAESHTFTHHYIEGRIQDFREGRTRDTKSGVCVCVCVCVYMYHGLNQ